ncbi:MAG: EI24 domain-containing protein [Mariprofundaceae bacterium]|nr:EI24 domain-containing protein [Mariprofundaceae bacterium]
MIEGALNLISGMKLMLAQRTLRSILWRILALLFVLMLLLTGGVFWLAEYLAHVWLPSGDAWYWQILSWAVWLLSVMLALLIGVVSFVALGSVAAAPWLDALAARTECLTGKEMDTHPASWWQQVMHSLANSIRPLFGLLIWGCVALALFFIPLVGQMAATLIWGYASIRFLNYELMDPVASRRGWNFERRKQEFEKRRWFYLGFGGAALGLMLVPVVNLFVLPAAVVGLSRISLSVSPES